MKLSKRTLSILKNFSLINQSILFRKGNKLSTISEAENQYAVATLEENIPKEFAIYDLNKLLAIINMMNDPEIEITENELIISNDTSETIFRLANRNTILASPDEEIIPDEPIAQFNLSKDQLDNCRKAMGILSTPEIAFVGDGIDIKIKTKDSEQAIGDSYSINIGDTTKEFESIIKAEYLIMLADDYEVNICDGSVLFRSNDVDYYIATSN